MPENILKLFPDTRNFADIFQSISEGKYNCVRVSFFQTSILKKDINIFQICDTRRLFESLRHIVCDPRKKKKRKGITRESLKILPSHFPPTRSCEYSLECTFGENCNRVHLQTSILKKYIYKYFLNL